MNRREFVRNLGIASGLSTLAWRPSLAFGVEAGAAASSAAPASDKAAGGGAAQPGAASPAEPAAPIVANDPGVAGAAWAELVDALRDADRAFLDGRRGRFDEFELAYAYRNLTHVLTFATQMYMYGDPDAPVFTSVQDAPVEKTLGGHPDVLYAFAPVRGDRRYRITGRRGDEAYLAFTLHRGVRGAGFEQAFDSHLNHHDLKTDADGRFEIIVSPERTGKNWLRASPDATEVYARVYRFDPDRDRPAHFRIESLDSPLPRRLDREEVALRLRQMTRIVRDLSLAIPQPLANPNQIGELWQIDPKGPSQMWQALDNVYCRGAFELAPDEALLLEGVAVESDYWGIQLWNPFLGSGDYRLGPVSINTRQARLGPKREFRVAIAREDPRVPGLDWVSTAGERRGTFFIRWMCPAERPPRPTCRVVPLAALRA